MLYAHMAIMHWYLEDKDQSNLVVVQYLFLLFGRRPGLVLEEEEGRTPRRTNAVAEVGSFLEDPMVVVGSALQKDTQLAVHHSHPGKVLRLQP